jgi:hypothetical protein
MVSEFRRTSSVPNALGETRNNKQYSKQNGKCSVRTDLVPDAPENNLDQYVQHIKNENEDESLVIIPEFLVILFKRFDELNNNKQGDTTDRYEGDKTDSPRTLTYTISLTSTIPI